MAYKQPNQIIDKLTKEPRVFTRDDAAKFIRGLLANDRDNSVYESYDDFVMKQGKPSYYKQIGNNPWTYPKGHYKTILADNDFLDEIAKNMDEDNFNEEWDGTDEDIEKSLLHSGYSFR